MHDYQVKLQYGSTFVIPADDYSLSNGYYCFWVGGKIVRMFPEEDVTEVKRLN